MRYHLVAPISSTLFIILIMKNQTLLSTFILLITLTLVAAFFAFNVSSDIIVGTVVTLSLVKFWLVAFQFMELKKANLFWKVSLISVLFLIILLIVLLRITY